MKYHKSINFIIFAMCLILLTGCSNMKSDTHSNPNTSVNNTRDFSESTAGKKQESEIKSMTITVNDTEYEVVLDDNVTVNSILNNMPLNLEMVRYAGHEFYSKLPFVPTFDKDRTSEIKAGHIYYWDGWNAFVINYIDSDISPYQVVHIGEIKDKSVCSILADGADNIQVEIK